MDENNRNWIIDYPKGKNFYCSIIFKIRGETVKNYVPEKLYCSHKYRIIMEMDFSEIEKINEYLFTEITVFNPKTNEEIMRRNSPIIKGDTKGGLKMSKKKCEDGKIRTNCHHGDLKIQFIASSFHFSKMHFKMKIEIKKTNDDNEMELVARLISPPFQSFSRKASQGKQTLKPSVSKPLLKRKKNGRKRKEEEENIPVNINNKEVNEDITKQMNDEELYDYFTKKLEEVKKMKNNLNEEEKIEVSEYTKELLKENPHFQEKQKENKELDNKEKKTEQENTFDDLFEDFHSNDFENFDTGLEKPNFEEKNGEIKFIDEDEFKNEFFDDENL